MPGARARDVLLVLGGATLTGVLAHLHCRVTCARHRTDLRCADRGGHTGLARSIASLTLYLVAGMAGVPWFADGTSGADFPTLGYIVGFVLAAGVVGAVAGRGGDRSPLRTIGTMVLGNLVIYAVRLIG